MNSEYAELKKLVEAEGLLAKQPVYYTYKFITTFAMLAAGLTVLALVDSFLVQLLNAVFLAFVFGQIGLLIHDTGHRQIFSKCGWQLTTLEIFPSIVLGSSFSWWKYTHNQHHGNPNHLELDPNFRSPFLALSSEHAVAKKNICRIVTKYQKYFFFPLLLIQGFGFRLASLQYLLAGKKARFANIELSFMAINAVAYLVGLLFLMNIWEVLSFLLVNQLLLGLYSGLLFAPNHKGMPIVDTKNRLDFLHEQVLTARNIKSNAIINFVYGGLNYQIEHHLFPNMPRNKLSEAQKIVKQFCKSKGIAYCEETLFGSYAQILSYMHQVSAPLRRKEV